MLVTPRGQRLKFVTLSFEKNCLNMFNFFSNTFVSELIIGRGCVNLDERCYNDLI